jgi:ankyrin repeat protein
MTSAPAPLLDAMRRRNARQVAELLAADPALALARAAGGETLVLHACYLGAPELVPVLLAGRAPDACEAAALGDVAALRTALEDDDDARVRRSSDGWTPLHLAAFFGRDEAAALLIDHGAPINGHATNATRNTPLHAALAGAVSATLVRRLVMAGASVTARDAHGATPLHLAASRGAEPLCDLLLARGADPGARTAEGATPGQMATDRGFPALGERLEPPAP